MSDQEKKSGGSVAPVVMMEQTTASIHKPIRAADMQEQAADLQHKHRAPAVETVAEELKDSSSRQQKDCDHGMSSEKKQSMAKKFSSITKKRGPSMETITLAPMEMGTKRDITGNTVILQPIPPSVDQSGSHTSNLLEVKPESVEKKGDNDSTSDEIAELRTPEADKKHSEWSDDEEAGGLPRSESRASRMSRAVRQLLCCGVRYEAPSEDDISPRPGFATGI